MKQKVLAVVGIVSLVLSIGIAQTNFIDASESVPGSTQDPVVTESYVEQLIKDSSLNQTVKAQEEMIGLLNSQLNSLKDKVSGNDIYEVVEVAEGTKLIGGQGTEIILRGGAGTAIRGELGGLQDVTGGTDIQEGSVPKNHLLITPRDDKRGVKVTKRATFMIRGDYTLE